MFYTSSWKSGFYTGLITGAAIYAMAKTPRGRRLLDKLRPVTDLIKGQVNSMARQTVEVLDGTVQVAENISRQEGSSPKPGVGYAGGNYDPVL